jgi:hypothetical protein
MADDYVRLEGALGSDVSLEVTPDTYWQTNSPSRVTRRRSFSEMPARGAGNRSWVCRC